MKSNILLIASWIGLLFGIILGVTLSYTMAKAWGTREIMYLKFIGTIIVHMFKALTIPIVVPSIIAAVGAMNPDLSGIL